MLAVTAAALILISGIFLNFSSAVPNVTITAQCAPPTTPATGCAGVVINQRVFDTLQYAPNKPIYVHHGEWITIKDVSNDVHTFTLVAKSALPTTVSQVLSCAPPPAPANICSDVLALHAPMGPPSAPPAPPYPNHCIAITSPTPAFQCLSDGKQLANGHAFPGLDTPFTLNPDGTIAVSGQSIILFPLDSITIQVTAPVGSVLHFMCAIHPWMQGEIIVTS